MNLVVRNLADRLVEEVRSRILSGAMAPDAPVRQDALATELGVSKIPLREALGRLEQDGLIRSIANRGFFVAPMSRQEAEEVFALRLKLEPQAAVAGAVAATPADQKSAKAALERLNRQIAARKSGVALANLEFHMALVRPSGKQITLGILERLHVLSDRYIQKHLEPQGRDARARSEHEAILKAWLDKSAIALDKLVHRHIDRTIKDLAGQLKP